MTDTKNKKLIHCIAVDYNFIWTTCTNYKCSDYLHRYGSCGDVSNRIESRVSHCPADLNKEICIRIDDTTVRASMHYYSNRSITMSKRSFTKQQRLIFQRQLDQKTKEQYFNTREVDVKCEKKNCIVNFD